MERLLKLATPLTALTVAVPPSVPTPGLVPMSIVIAAVLVVIGLPPASWTVTWTAGLMLTPATVLVGWVVNASRLAGPTLTLKLVLVALASPLLGLVPMEIVMTALPVVTGLPKLSRTWTVNAGAIEVADSVLPGCWLKPS